MAAEANDELRIIRGSSGANEADICRGVLRMIIFFSCIQDTVCRL